MSGGGGTRQDFADGTYHFRFGLADWQELQELTGKGPEKISLDLKAREWNAADIFHTIRIGLCGALDQNENLSSPEAAHALCELYIVKRGAWLYYKSLAYLIIGACLAGDPTDKKKARREPSPIPKAIPSDFGILEAFTPLAPPTDSPPSKSAE